MNWEALYSALGITDFIYFISSSEIQEMLFPVKIVFVVFAAIFLVFVIHFMINSSWMQYKFLEDVTEFFSWQAFGQRQMEKQWTRIRKRTESGSESDYKLAIIDADDFLLEVLDNRGYEGNTFEDSIEKAGRLIAPILDEVLRAHEVRNAIVYNPDYSLSAQEAQKILDIYESAAKNIGLN